MNKYRAYNIIFDITEADVADLVGDEYGYPLYSDYEKACEDKIREIEGELPSEMILEIEDDGRDIDEQLCDMITNQTGYLVDQFCFEEVCQ